MTASSVSLLDAVNRAIEADNVPLPVFSAAASRIQQELAKVEPDIRIIEKIITADQALSTQVLKIANSSFYRGLTEVSTVRAAIMRLGIQEVEKIVLLATSQQHFKSNDKMLRLVMKKLWQHSVGCAYGAVWLSKRYAYGIDAGQAFFAGLFHDVGKLFILMVIEQVKRTNKDVKVTDALLLEAMEKLHAREGGKLLVQWNMPEHFCFIARNHHADEIDSKNILLLVVRMANLVCHKHGIGLVRNASLLLPATLEADLLNLNEIDLAELEIVLEDTKVLTG
jgi:HD-like signal output (HDOD) protein